MPDLFSPAGREVGLVLETWQLVQEANLIEIMVMWTRHVSQGDELKYGSTCSSLQHVTIKEYGLFLFLSLNPQSLPHSFNSFCIAIFCIFFLSSYFCDFLCRMDNLSYTVSLLSDPSSGNDRAGIVGAQ